MKNYNIEGNIDFYSELYKLLDIPENELKTQEDEKLCLITNEELKEYFIKLNCGHKFNYIPLYNDIQNHKNKFNSLEDKKSQLTKDEIRCPYCRNIQNELLPYHEELGLPKIHGVNFIDLNKKTNIHCVKKCCQYLIHNNNFDASKPVENNSINTSANSNYFKCANFGFYEINKYIAGYQGEDQHFCYLHKNKKIREHNKIIKDKAKEEIKKAKESEKIKAKEEKKKIKENTENLVLGPINIKHIGCLEILKFGSKKGLQCSCKIYNEDRCKRHVKNKIPVIEEI